MEVSRSHSPLTFRDLGTAKILAVNEYINSLLESDVKFIVFAHHIEVLDGVEHNLVQ